MHGYLLDSNGGWDVSGILGISLKKKEQQRRQISDYLSFVIPGTGTETGF